MKKILLIAAFFISTGVITSCTKDNVAPSTTKTVAGNTDDETGGVLGTGDGDIDRPVKKPH